MYFVTVLTRQITWYQGIYQTPAEICSDGLGVVVEDRLHLGHTWGLKWTINVLYFQTVSYFCFRLCYVYKYLMRSNIADFLCGLFNRWNDDQSKSFLIRNRTIVFSCTLSLTPWMSIRNAISSDFISTQWCNFELVHGFSFCLVIDFRIFHVFPYAASVLMGSIFLGLGSCWLKPVTTTWAEAAISALVARNFSNYQLKLTPESLLKSLM